MTRARVDRAYLGSLGRRVRNATCEARGLRNRLFAQIFILARGALRGAGSLVAGRVYHRQTGAMFGYRSRQINGHQPSHDPEAAQSVLALHRRIKSNTCIREPDGTVSLNPQPYTLYSQQTHTLNHQPLSLCYVHFKISL